MNAPAGGSFADRRIAPGWSGASAAARYLRAERAHPKLDRVYTAIYRATDIGGNVVEHSAPATVPNAKRSFELFLEWLLDRGSKRPPGRACEDDETRCWWHGHVGEDD